MTKTKGGIITTDEEIRALIVEANRLRDYEQRATKAWYDRKHDAIIVAFSRGVELRVPRKLLQGLETATPAELSKVEVVGAQDGLSWKSLDVDHYIPALIAGIFGSRQWMSKIRRMHKTARKGRSRKAA